MDKREKAAMTAAAKACKTVHNGQGGERAATLKRPSKTENNARGFSSLSRQKRVCFSRTITEATARPFIYIVDDSRQ